MTEQQTTQKTDNSQTAENRQKPFKYEESAVMAIRNVENKKETKTMEKALHDFKEGTEGLNNINFFQTEKTQKVAIDVQKLGKIHELAKGAKAETVDLTVETDKPIHAQLLSSNFEERGEILLAPRILEDIENQREEITENTGEKQVRRLLIQAKNTISESSLENNEEVKQKVQEALNELNGGETA